MAPSKMTKKPANKSPKNYRTITEKLKVFGKKNSKLVFKLKTEGLVILYVITIFSILFLSFDLFANIQKTREITFQKEKIQAEISLWENVASKFKNSREAYYKLAVLNYELGDIDKAKFYLSKSLYIDPNFDKARDLKKILDTY